MTLILPKKNHVALNGVLLLDKTAGWSSNDALIKAKRLMSATKAGHTGTLDPFATGVLPLCFGEATKFAQDLLDADKTYRAVIHLGLTTATGDTEGEVLEAREVNVTKEQIYTVLAKFRGHIKQVPPMYSALKRDGKPLYEYVRAGITLDREARDVKIHLLEYVDYQAPYLTVRVVCSKGTYIRVLGEDIGGALGCGAHLQALRRTQVGHLLLDGCLTLDALMTIPETERPDLLNSVDSLLLSFPEVTLSDSLAQRFLQGQRLTLVKEGIVPPSKIGRVRVYRQVVETGQPVELPRELIGTAQLHDYGVLAPERLISNTLKK